MIRRLRWWPDTCACALELEYDDSVQPVVNTCAAILGSCSAHAAITDNAARLLAVKIDNDLKNDVRDFVLETFSILRDTYQDVNGAQYFDFKPTISWAWSFNETTRAITITFTGIVFSQPTRNQIRQALDARFGAGKVILG